MILIALLLTSVAAAHSGTSEEYQVAFEKAFRSSFRSRSIEQCRASAKNAAAAKIDVTPICECVTDRLFATKSVEELRAQTPSIQLQLLSSECIMANLPATNLKKP